MVFGSKGMVYISKNVVKREGKADLTFVKIANPTTYESNEFFAHNETKENLESLGQGELVDVFLHVDGRYTSLEVKKA